MLATRGRGAVEPNPMVGALVVRDGQVVGEGWHGKFGGPHAEPVAFDDAKDAAAGATLYVTLEPCCHHGKTPPCTDRVIASGVRRVVIGMADPFPQVAGRGTDLLRQAGIDVTVGCLEEGCRALNRPYLKLLRTGRPFVHAKWAMSLDGRIATATGDSKWISNEASRRHAHQFRGIIDAIIVGTGTVLADDPSLTARPPGPRVATRVVLDTRGRIPRESKLVQTARDLPTLIATTSLAAEQDLEALRAAGCECLVLPEIAGRLSIDALLEELGRRWFTNVLVEGGSGVLGSFVAERAIDAVRVYVAPCIIGGARAMGPVGGDGFSLIRDSHDLGPLRTESLEGDLFITNS
ncbi:Riboflavin biosynthesis protein RibD [Planctomycetes bacterium Pan216]|uniref:Riboflavin biosynthesis protein RibD n=2 Tax=Kolteria novifilia TaxID=2527975 RepID=A0A518BC71_9BACT|nr:Riboflavin biosynthesis protein RibD [Planctomycetes bacterium Pan216]